MRRREGRSDDLDPIGDHPITPGMNMENHYEGEGFSLGAEPSSFRPRMYENQDCNWIPTSFKPALRNAHSSRHDENSFMPPDYGSYTCKMAGPSEQEDSRRTPRSGRILSWIKGKFRSSADDQFHVSNSSMKYDHVGSPVPGETVNNFSSINFKVASPLSALRQSPIKLDPCPESPAREDLESPRAVLTKKERKKSADERRQDKMRKRMEAGTPTAKMKGVREKIVRNKKEQAWYKAYKSMSFQQNDDRPTTPRIDLPCTQGAFRNQIELWVKDVLDFTRSF